MWLKVQPEHLRLGLSVAMQQDMLQSQDTARPIPALPVPSVQGPSRSTSAQGSVPCPLLVPSCAVCSTGESADAAAWKQRAELCLPPPAGSSGSEIIQPVLAKAAASHQPGAPVLHCCVSSVSPLFCVFSMSLSSVFSD